MHGDIYVKKVAFAIANAAQDYAPETLPEFQSKIISAISWNENMNEPGLLLVVDGAKCGVPNLFSMDSPDYYRILAEINRRILSIGCEAVPIDENKLGIMQPTGIE